MSTVKKPNKFQEIQDSLTRVRKRVMAIGAYKGCMHMSLAAVNDLNKAEELLEDISQEFKVLQVEFNKSIAQNGSDK